MTKEHPKEDIVELIRKCLALSESSNEHEAAIALAKAQELLEKYNLSMAEVDVADSSTPELIIGEAEYRGDGWQRYLYNVLAKHNFCRTIRHDGTLHILGRSPNVTVTCEMGIWLIGQLERLSVTEASKYTGCILDPETLKVVRVSDISKKQWRRDFLMGAIKRIDKRLSELSIKRQEDNPSIRALVVNLAAEVDAFLNKEFPRRISRTINFSRSEGYSAGYLAGDKISIIAPSRHVYNRPQLT